MIATAVRVRCFGCSRIPDNGGLVMQSEREKTTYRENIEAAFSAWQLAIKEKLGHPSARSFLELAKQYGASITDESCLDEVSEWFDWDKIGEYMSCDEHDEIASATGDTNVVDEILDLLHENVQFYNSCGDASNHDVLKEMRPWIEEALINCDRRE